MNPGLPPEALADAFRKLTRPDGAETVARNRTMHRLLVDSVTVEYRTAGGEIRGAQARGERRAHLRQLLSVAVGGVVFTTIHEFFPEEKGDRHPVLSDRRNVVVIADEAHPTQYDFIDGLVRHMRDALPRASFIGFTGTPIEVQGPRWSPGSRSNDVTDGDPSRSSREPSRDRPPSPAGRFSRHEPAEPALRAAAGA